MSQEREAKAIKDKILASRQMNIANWNYRNLSRHLRRLQVDLAVIYLDVELSPDGLATYLTSQETIPVSEILKDVSNCDNIILILRGAALSNEEFDTLVSTFHKGNMLVCCGAQDHKLFLFSLFCEMQNFVGRCDPYGEAVTIGKLFHVIKNICQSYVNIDKSIALSSHTNLENCDFFAWHSLQRLSDYADLNSLTDYPNHERVNDTVRRIFDCALALRQPHFTFSKRLTSSEALFQLACLPAHLLPSNWISQTRFFIEINGYHQTKKRETLRARKRIASDLPQRLFASMVEVPAGRYRLGSYLTDTGSEPPSGEFSTEIGGFKIGRFPVTEELWYEVVSGESTCSGNLPKTNIDFFEAVEFCELLNEITSRSYTSLEGQPRFRVPSEIHWEVAARGPNSQEYPWGDKFDPERCNSGSRHNGLTPVGTFSPAGDSFFGCADMVGNIREWTCSYAGTKGNDWTEHTQWQKELSEIHEFSRMVIRGGSHSYFDHCMLTWMRHTMVASASDGSTGLRVTFY